MTKEEFEKEVKRLFDALNPNGDNLSPAVREARQDEIRSLLSLKVTHG